MKNRTLFLFLVVLMTVIASIVGATVGAILLSP